MLKSILIAPSEEILQTCLLYVKTTLGYVVNDYYVCKDAEEVKSLIKELNLDSTIVYLTHCYLLPWTAPNLKFIISIFKKFKVSIFLLDLRMNLTVDVYGKPAADILAYINQMQYCRKEHDL